ncbi:antichymotrypsin-2-like [Microplitis demolitor]|uniref:antichymotrypsin-2-like n=1 Tax=Microplitis demolitor TaxID=69319 RepID=UPI0004CCEFB7|nr:antichymotrypsin-2-like [Microplitis demolitor]
MTLINGTYHKHLLIGVFKLFVLIIFINIKMAQSVQEFHTFTSNLYKTTIEEYNDNVIFSPISIHVILSFISHGAKGKTAEEMINGLCIKDISKLNIDYKNIISILNSTDKAELHLANSLYLHNDIEVLDDFKTLGIDYYSLIVSKMNFSDNVQSAKQINNWVLEKTNNKITDIVSPDDITEETKMFLINAIYFKGPWKDPFDSQRTSHKIFYTANNVHVLTDMMIKKQHYVHGDLPNLNARFLEIPYSDDNLSMIIILPYEVEGLSYVEKNFNWNYIITAESSNGEIILHVPKFKIESTIDLQQILTNMGLKSMFEDTADLSGITNVPVKISKVMQKAFLEINEEGSEAAAATVVRIRLKRMAVQTEEFIVDRPFMVAIRHKLLDIPLFVGQVKVPDIITKSTNKDEL